MIEKSGAVGFPLSCEAPNFLLDDAPVTGFHLCRPVVAFQAAACVFCGAGLRLVMLGMGFRDIGSAVIGVVFDALNGCAGYAALHGAGLRGGGAAGISRFGGLPA